MIVNSTTAVYSTSKGQCSIAQVSSVRRLHPRGIAEYSDASLAAPCAPQSKWSRAKCSSKSPSFSANSAFSSRVGCRNTLTSVIFDRSFVNDTMEIPVNLVLCREALWLWNLPRFVIEPVQYTNSLPVHNIFEYKHNTGLRIKQPHRRKGGKRILVLTPNHALRNNILPRDSLEPDRLYSVKKEIR